MANPAILEQAISKSQNYDVSMERAASQVRTTEELYEWLVTEDIGRAADVLRPADERSDGCDGFVCLEVSPYLTDDTEAAVWEGRRCFSLLGRPNVMIKVPVTPAGIPAVGALLAEGVNVNITLIFSWEVYLQVIQVYLAGLELRLHRGYAIERVATVASFLVIHVDVLVDSLLDAHRLEANLRGQAGIAHARLAYHLFQREFAGERFSRIKRHGAQTQRRLWASTQPKHSEDSPLKCVKALVAPDTVSTLSPATLQRLMEADETVALAAMDCLSALEAQRYRDLLIAAGISLADVAERLKKFQTSEMRLMQSLKTRSQRSQESPTI